MTPWGSANRGTQAKTITSCDNAFVTNILLAQAAHRTPPGSFALCESEATATNVFCSESKATATNVFCSESKATATKHPAGTEINPRYLRKQYNSKNNYANAKSVGIVMVTFPPPADKSLAISNVPS